MACNNQKQDSDKLEHFQFAIARIITGARKGTSHDLIYIEANWLSLSERLSLYCIKQFVEMSENHSPEYLKSILPDKIGKIRPNSRNAENVVTNKRRRETYSFIPSTTCAWNQLPKGSQNMEYVSEKLKPKPNPLFYEGNYMYINNIKHVHL